MAASTLNAIFRDVYILSQHIIDPIEYVRLTNGSDIILQFRDIDIPEGSTADVVVIRPDGTGIQNEATVIVDPGNVVGIEVTDTMFSVLGTSHLQVRITHGDSVIVNFAIPVHVRENYTEGDYPPSENEGGFFDDAKEAVADANAAADSANKAAADANAAADAANQAAEDANTALEDLPNEYYMLTGGTAIPKNADMDSYKTPGNYYCATDANAATLQNSPFPISFTLKIECSNGTGYPMQTYRVWNTGEKAVRVFSYSAWGAYEYFSSDDALVTEKEFDALHTSEKTIVGAINSLMQPITSLTSRDNLNNITTPGRYEGGGSYVPNSPFSGSYDLEVIRTTDGIAQSFFCTDTGERAFRLQTDGAWSEYAYFRADATVFDQVEQSFPDWASTVSVPALLTSNKTLTGAINEVNAAADAANQAAQGIDTKVQQAVDSAVTPEALQPAVNNYFESNPVLVDCTPTVEGTTLVFPDGISPTPGASIEQDVANLKQFAVQFDNKTLYTE